MTKLIKKITCIFMIVISTGACSTIKDGLTIKKKNNADEFLIEKKSPLILPPEFESLPVPKKSANKNDNEEFDVESILKNTNNEISSKENIDENLERTILDKIKEVDAN